MFAGAQIPGGTVIDVSPVLVLDPQENAQHIEHTALYHYTYNWPLLVINGDRPVTTQAVVLGLGSMFNHSIRSQNVGWHRDLTRQVIVYRALRDIREGEELCISYGDHLTFLDVDKVESESDVEDDCAVLGKIEWDS